MFVVVLTYIYTYVRSIPSYIVDQSNVNAFKTKIFIFRWCCHGITSIEQNYTKNIKIEQKVRRHLDFRHASDNNKMKWNVSIHTDSSTQHSARTQLHQTKWAFVYFVAYFYALYVITVECANSNNTIMENETLFYEVSCLELKIRPWRMLMNTDLDLDLDLYDLVNEKNEWILRHKMQNFMHFKLATEKMNRKTAVQCKCKTSIQWENRKIYWFGFFVVFVVICSSTITQKKQNKTIQCHYRMRFCITWAWLTHTLILFWIETMDLKNHRKIVRCLLLWLCARVVSLKRFCCSKMTS